MPVIRLSVFIAFITPPVNGIGDGVTAEDGERGCGRGSTVFAWFGFTVVLVSDLIGIPEWNQGESAKRNLATGGWGRT